MRMRQFPRSLGPLGTALLLSAAPVSSAAWAQQSPCPDLDRLDQAGNAEGCAARVRSVPKEWLRGAPQLGRSDRPGIADRQWAVAVHTYYGVPPYWMQDATALPPAAAPDSGGSGSSGAAPH